MLVVDDGNRIVCTNITIDCLRRDLNCIRLAMRAQGGISEDAPADRSISGSKGLKEKESPAPVPEWH
jgi:hypothetical protein